MGEGAARYIIEGVAGHTALGASARHFTWEAQQGTLHEWLSRAHYVGDSAGHIT